MFRTLLALLLAAAGAAFPQRFTLDHPESSTLVARDASGNWITVDASDDKGIVLRKRHPGTGAALLFERHLGDSTGAELRDLIPLADGSVLVVAWTKSDKQMTTPGVIQTKPVQTVAPQSWLARVSAEGNLVFAMYLSVQAGSVSVRAVAVASNGDLVIACEVPGRIDDPDLAEARGMIVLWRINGAAARTVARRRLGGSDISSVAGIAADLHNGGGDGFLLGGTTRSDDLQVSAGAFQTARKGGRCRGPGIFSQPFACANGFVARLRADLSVERATYIGGDTESQMIGIGLDSGGAPVLALNPGGLLGPPPSFPTTPGSYQPVLPLDANRSRVGIPVIAKLTPGLERLEFATSLGGRTQDFLRPFRLDEQGRAIVTGVTYSREFPFTGAFAAPCGPYDMTGASPPLTFIARLSRDGTSLESSAYFYRGEFRLAAEGGPPAPGVALTDGRHIFRAELDGARIANRSPASSMEPTSAASRLWRLDSFSRWAAAGSRPTPKYASMASRRRFSIAAVPKSILWFDGKWAAANASASSLPAKAFTPRWVRSAWHRPIPA